MNKVKFKLSLPRKRRDGLSYGDYLKTGKTDQQLETEKELQEMIKNFDFKEGVSSLSTG